GAVPPFLWRGIITDLLIIDGWIMYLRPGRFLHGEPVTIGFQPPFEEEVRFIFLLRNEADDVLAQPGRSGVGLQVSVEAVLVFLLYEALNCFSCRAHISFSRCTSGRRRERKF